MPGLQMMITDAGLDAIVNAQQGGTDTVLIEALGLTNTPFVMAPTLTALPGEFRRIDTVGGQAVAENIIHVVAYDPDPISYDVTGLGLFDGDGTLIAVHSAEADPILSKAELATSLFAIDITLAADLAAVIEFGEPLFNNPPATETVPGVVEISDNDEADAGIDDATAMSPKKVRRVLDAAVALIDAAIAALTAATNNSIATLTGRTITGAGLASGGGDLSADRQINVVAASQAQARTGTASDVALTPEALGPIMKSLGTSGYATIPGADPANTVMIQWGRYTAATNASTPVSFPTSFSSPAYSVVAGGTQDTNNDAQDNWPAVDPSSITANGFSIINANQQNDPGCYLAIGRIDLS